MDMSILDGYDYRDQKFPESRYEDGDFDIEQLYDGIVQAYSDGYHAGIKDERDHFFNVNKSLTKDVIYITLDKVCEYLENNYGIELQLAFGNNFINNLRKAMGE